MQIFSDFFQKENFNFLSKIWEIYKMQPFFLLPNGKKNSQKKSLIMDMVYIYIAKLQSNMCSMAQGTLKLPSHLVLAPLMLACLTLK